MPDTALKKLEITASPHLQGKTTAAAMMKDVIIALLPATLAAVYFFGKPALILIATSILAAMIAESLVCLLRKEKNLLFDCSAILTGLLFGLILPPAVSWQAAALGAVVAIVVGKHLFGGLGSNIFNPALVGRAFVAAAYPTMITTYLNPGRVDTLAEATPLMLQKFSNQLTSIDKLFVGNIPGSIGETSAVCLLAGGVYLLAKKSADWRIPVTILVTVALISQTAFWLNPDFGPPLFHLFAGGLLMGAFFMATDPVTSPFTKKGKFIFAASCGTLIMVLRYFSNLAEGVLYSILFMNAVTPLINRYSRRVPFGRKKQATKNCQKNETNN